VRGRGGRLRGGAPSLPRRRCCAQPAPRPAPPPACKQDLPPRRWAPRGPPQGPGRPVAPRARIQARGCAGPGCTPWPLAPAERLRGRGGGPDGGEARQSARGGGGAFKPLWRQGWVGGVAGRGGASPERAVRAPVAPPGARAGPRFLPLAFPARTRRAPPLPARPDARVGWGPPNTRAWPAARPPGVRRAGLRARHAPGRGPHRPSPALRRPAPPAPPTGGRVRWVACCARSAWRGAEGALYRRGVAQRSAVKWVNTRAVGSCRWGVGANGALGVFQQAAVHRCKGACAAGG
jgi:hypothetical protein